MALFDRQKCVEFAWQNAMCYSQKYPRASNDCTNFVSQCLYEGGWSMVIPAFPLKLATRISSYWFTQIRPGSNETVPGFDGTWSGTQSWSWAAAPEFYEFCRSTGRAELVVDKQAISEAILGTLEPADVIQCWGSSYLVHTMIVVQGGRDPEHFKYAQHEPLKIGSGSRIVNELADHLWSVWRPKSTFE